jgi:sn-glycerol 3-phosphate transport system substrate-binding protein
MHSTRSTLTAVAALGLMLSAAPARAEVELDMYYHVAVGGPLQAILDGYVADFEVEHPDIKVNPIYTGGFMDTLTKVATAIEAGDPPHLGILINSQLLSLIDDGYITPISDIEGADQEWLESYYPAFMANSYAEGKVWSIPQQRSTAVLYYNKEAFAEAGLDPEQPPQTWDEMVEMAEALTIRDDAGNVTQWGLAIPSSAAVSHWMIVALAWQNDHLLMNEAGTEVYFDHPATLEAMQFWVDLAAEHQVTPSGVTEWGTLPAEFMAGRFGMIWHTTGNLTRIRDEAPFDFGVAFLPGRDGPRSVVGGGNMYIFEGISDEEKQAALTFIRWMTAPERAADWSLQTGYVAVSPAAYELPELAAYIEEFPEAAVARDQLEISTGELMTFENQRVYNIIQQAIEAAVTGAKTPEEALADAQAQADRVLVPYRN